MSVPKSTTLAISKIKTFATILFNVVFDSTFVFKTYIDFSVSFSQLLFTIEIFAKNIFYKKIVNVGHFAVLNEAD